LDNNKSDRILAWMNTKEMRTNCVMLHKDVPVYHNTSTILVHLITSFQLSYMDGSEAKYHIFALSNYHTF